MAFWTKIALSAVLATSLAATAPCIAFADDEAESEASVSTAAAEETKPHVILSGDTEIEKLSDAFDKAKAAVDEARAKVAEIQVRIDKIESELPAQQARSDSGMKQRYIMQSNKLAVLDSLLSEETLSDFIRHTEYLEIVTRDNLDALNQLKDMKADLEAARAEQEKLNEEAETTYADAESALRADQEKRAQKQKEGVADAQEQASSKGGEASVGVAYDGGEQPEDYREAANDETDVLNDGADWFMSKDEFVAEWAPRIDEYLEGSALEGQGKNFAEASWKHCVDPRWSPAISNTESGKGAICIRPHNAWGWGAADIDPAGLALEWGSWEEAIDEHVAGLAKGYGYTISLSNAQKYCPNTWQSWYNKTLDEMSQI